MSSDFGGNTDFGGILPILVGIPKSDFGGLSGKERVGLSGNF